MGIAKFLWLLFGRPPGNPLNAKYEYFLDLIKILCSIIAMVWLCKQILSFCLHCRFWDRFSKKTIPISVNYHFTRQCNADCGFCFHTALTSYVAPLKEAKEALRLLANEGMKKLNFAGGEPFLKPKFLGELCRYAKEELHLESVSIVSNGTLIKESWLRKHAQYIDILAVSCDSFHAETNAAIGRKDRGSKKPFDNVGQLFRIRDWCNELGIRFKLNTVVCTLNWREDMADVVQQLAPFRWKVFQVLVVEGENEGSTEDEERLRDARELVISDEQFADFCKRHDHVKGLTPEPNSLMRASYLVSVRVLGVVLLDIEC